MKEIIKDVTPPSLQEDGCIDYHWAQGDDEPTQFLLYMNWRDRAAFDAHVRSVHVKKAEQQIASLESLTEPTIGKICQFHYFFSRHSHIPPLHKTNSSFIELISQ